MKVLYRAVIQLCYSWPYKRSWLMSAKNEAGKSWYYSLDGERKGPKSADDIAMLISAGTISQQAFVWTEGYQNWVPITETDFNRFFISSTPPPLTGNAVDNRVVWWLAFAPVIGQFFAGFLAGLSNTEITNFWWVTLVLNIVLSYADEQRLKKAGHSTDQMGAAWLVPVYLYKRAAILKQNNAYFIVWVVLFALVLLGIL